MIRRYSTPCRMTSVSSPHSMPMIHSGNSMATAMNNSPILKLKRMPMAVMRRMGWVSRRPQYWLDSTTTPSPTPLTTICNRNCTRLAWVAPVMACS